MSYRLSRPAARDLKEIGDYIARDNRQAAAKTVVAIAEKFLFLAQHPHLSEPQPRLNNLCKSKIGNYLIFYRPIDNDIEIVRVIHGSRDLENIFKTV
jgi:toxin ParE1/3/4